MDAANLWCVVERNGVVHRMTVEHRPSVGVPDSHAYVALLADGGGFWSGSSPMSAVLRLAESALWDVREIRMPGEGPLGGATSPPVARIAPRPTPLATAGDDFDDLIPF